MSLEHLSKPRIMLEGICRAAQNNVLPFEKGMSRVVFACLQAGPHELLATDL
jgi:hypothetical protein